MSVGSPFLPAPEERDQPTDHPESAKTQAGEDTGADLDALAPATRPLSGPEWGTDCRECGGACEVGDARDLRFFAEVYRCDACGGTGVDPDLVRCPWGDPRTSERDCPLDCDGGTVEYDAALAWLREGATIHVAANLG